MMNFIYSKKKLIIVSVLVIIFLIVVKILTYHTFNEKLSNLLEKKGFILSSGGTIYEKELSDLSFQEYTNNVKNKINSSYEILYFYMDNYLLRTNKLDYSDGVDETLTVTYDYKTEELTYNYRVVIGSSNAIFEGTYDENTDKFTCVNIYSYNFDIERNENLFCDKIKYDVEDFSYEVMTFITSPSILGEMKMAK